MRDKSTDHSDKSQLIIYHSFVNVDTSEIHSKFLSLIEIAERCNAENLNAAIVDCLENDQNKYPVEKIVGFISDGASVIVATHESISKRLKDSYDDLFIQHSMTHCQALMVRDAESVIPDFVEDTIKATLRHFSVALRKKEFGQICELNEEEYSNLVKFGCLR
ncbi:unnamed protein product [Caretta caretta]